MQEPQLLRVPDGARAWWVERHVGEPALRQEARPLPAAVPEEAALVGRLGEVDRGRAAPGSQPPQDLRGDGVRRVRGQAQPEAGPQRVRGRGPERIRPRHHRVGAGRVPGQELEEDERVQPRGGERGQVLQRIRDVADSGGPTPLEEPDRLDDRRLARPPVQRPPRGDERLDPGHEAQAERQLPREMRQLQVAVGVHETGEQHARPEVDERPGRLAAVVRTSHPRHAALVHGNGPPADRLADPGDDPGRPQDVHAPASLYRRRQIGTGVCHHRGASGCRWFIVGLLRMSLCSTLKEPSDCWEPGRLCAESGGVGDCRRGWAQHRLDRPGGSAGRLDHPSLLAVA